MIHSVSAQPKYSKSESKGYQGPISVEYEWVAQESVQILAGASVMFLATIIVSVVFLFQACGISDDDEDGVQSNGHSHHETTTPNFMGVPIGLDASGAGGVPKYDWGTPPLISDEYMEHGAWTTQFASARLYPYLFQPVKEISLIGSSYF